MPRNARNNVNSNFFHVIIQGLNKEYIFQNELEIETYLKYMREKIINKHLQIIAYCIMNNHAHCLIYTRDTNEISKLMSQVNTKYAIFYNRINNRCGFVFRNRYKSEEILTYSHLVSCIHYIHNNPVKAKMCKSKNEYKYSSYNEYSKESKLVNIEDISKLLKQYDTNIEEILKANVEPYKFIENIDFEDKESMKKIVLKEFCVRNDLNSIEEIINNKKCLRELASIMYIEYNFTQKEIADLLGVNRLKIHRILNEL